MPRSTRPAPSSGPAGVRAAFRAAAVAAALLAAALAAPSAAVAESALPAPGGPAAALPLGAPPVIAPAISSFTLANGLAVVVIPDHRAPVVTHMIWYKVGAADDPPGKSGIAHYLEHLMFKGTKANPAGAFSKTVAEIGGQENAFTAADYTSYFQRVAKEHLGLVMGLEADRMSGLVLDEPTALPERKVILEERSQRVENDPGARFSEAMDAALYVSSPYRIPIIGWRHEMETLTYEDALAFYNKWYTPNNAVLVIAGDVTPEEVRPLAEATYGKVARRFEVAPRARPTEPPPLAERTVTLADPRVTEPGLRLVWLAPSNRTAKPGEAEALDVLCEALGGGASSRLYRALVVDKPVASSVGCRYYPTSYDDTKVVIYASPAEGVALPALREAVEAVVDGAKRDGLGAEEVMRAKRRLVSGAVHAQDNQSALARIFGAALTSGETIASVQSWPARVYAVAPADATAAGAYLVPERQVAGFLVGTTTGVAVRAKGGGGAWPVGTGSAIRAVEPSETVE